MGDDPLTLKAQFAGFRDPWSLAATHTEVRSWPKADIGREWD